MQINAGKIFFYLPVANNAFRLYFFAYSNLEQIQTWADLLRQESADFTVKRNLILAIVRYVKCINSDGDMEMSIVMTKNKKWRLAFLFPPAILKGFLSLKLQNFAVK